MAKKQPAKVGDTVEMLKPYLERALRDEDFRNDLKDAMQAARELYGPLAKSGGVKSSAKTIATDRKTQEQLLRAMDDIASAAGTLPADGTPAALGDARDRRNGNLLDVGAASGILV